MRTECHREYGMNRRDKLAAALVALAIVGGGGMYLFGGQAVIYEKVASLADRARSVASAYSVRLPNSQGAPERGTSVAYPVRLAISQGAFARPERGTSAAYPVRVAFFTGNGPNAQVSPAGPNKVAFPDSWPADESAVASNAGDKAGLVTYSGQPAGRTLKETKATSLGFAQAFSDLLVPRAAKPPRKVGDTDLLAVNFNLGKARATDNAIEIRKPVHADGIDKGKVALKIVNDTTIMVDSSQLAGLFGDKPDKEKLSSLASSKSGTFVDFDTLRAAGFDVRYDPVRDIIVMSSGNS